MAFSVHGKTYETCEACLDDILRIVRTGLPEGELPDVMSEDAESDEARRKRLLKHRSHLAKLFDAVRDQYRRNVQPVDELQQIRFMTLEAEFYQQYGQPARAMSILKPLWKSLEPQLNQWLVRKRPLEPSGDKRLLRQKLWALLHYVFYGIYRVAGQHAKALKYFLDIEKIVDQELMSGGHKAFGTKAMCHYYIGLCYHVNGGLEQARERLLKAQEAIDRRTARRQSTQRTEDQVRTDLVFHTIFTARVLSALGWIALQQGTLSHGIHLLQTAQTMSAPTGQESLKLFIQTILWITKRRRAAPDSEEHSHAMQRLERLFEAYQGTEDVAHRRRCTSELVRGHLDRAEFWNDDDQLRKHELKRSLYWLDKLDRISDEKARVRYLLHRVRYLIVAEDFDAAKEGLTEARKAASAALVTQRAFYLLDAMITMGQDHASDAIKTLETQLDKITSHTDMRSRRDMTIADPVLEAECYLRLAQAHSMEQSWDECKRRLGQWEILSRFVDNRYLHNFAQGIHASVPLQERFVVEHDFKINTDDSEAMTLHQRLEEFECWLLKTVLSRPAMKPKREGEKSRWTITALARVYGPKADRRYLRKRVHDFGLSHLLRASANSRDD